MSSSNNSAGMPSLYDTSTSASSTGSRSSVFFPISHPKPAESYYNQYSLASAAKKAAHGGRAAHSELGWTEPLQHEVATDRPKSARRQQQPIYAASEPGITRQQTDFAQSDRFRGYFTRRKEKHEHSSEMGGRGSNNLDDFHRQQFQQSREQNPSRGRSPDGIRNTSGTPDDHYLSSTERSRSLSSNRLSSNLRMEPRPNFRSETTKQGSQREVYRSSSPLPRIKSQSVDQSLYERSSSVEMSLAGRSSDVNIRERSAPDQLSNERESAGSPHPNVGKLSYYGRAEIETPTPTSVRDLKQRLWDPDESLHHWHSQNERLQKTQLEPQRLGFSPSTKYSQSPESNTPTESRSSTSSTRRSISPIPSRSKESRVHSLLLNPRYSHAAARVASRSPSRKASALQSTSPAHTNSGVESVQSELQPRNLAKPQTNSTDVYDRLETDPEAVVANGVKAESEITTVMANKTVASLMARISAVTRSDPAEALAQIDAILSSENASTETAREEVDLASIRHDSDSDGKEWHQDEKQVTGRQPQYVAPDPLGAHLEEESSIAATSVSSMTNPTYQGGHTIRNEVMSFSNKPSLLQAYGSTALMGKKEWIRSSSEQENNSSPPSTISLSSKEKGRKPGESARQQSLKCPQIVASNSAELAVKIRRWDEMSAPDIAGVKSDDSGYPVEASGRVPNTPVNRRRAHPWDSSMPPQLDRKNTAANAWTKQYKPKHTAPDKVTSFPTDRYFDEESNSILQTGYSEDGFDMDPKIQSTPTQQQQAETMLFDSTWVSVPESSFFRQHSAFPRADLEPVKADAATPTRLLMSSFDQEDALSTPDHAFGHGRVPRQPDVSSPRPPSRLLRSDNESHRPLQTFSPQTRAPTRDFRSLSPRAVRNRQILHQSSSGDSSSDHGVGVALLNKPKSRGLRSFLPKRRALKGNAVALEEDISLLSQSSDVFALDVELPPPLQSRGRRYASTQDRERARSLEDSRSRNPNIAKKFSRLLRVKDADTGMI